MPPRPALSDSQKASFPAPMAVIGPTPVMTTPRGLLAMAHLGLRLPGSALEGPRPPLGVEPLIDVRLAEAPVLPHLRRGDAPALGEGVEGGFGDFEVGVQLVKRQNLTVQAHRHGVTPKSGQIWSPTPPGRGGTSRRIEVRTRGRNRATYNQPSLRRRGMASR